MPSRRFISREEEAAQDAVYRQLDPQALEDDESATLAPVPDAVEARLAEIETRLNRASAGPWQAELNGEKWEVWAKHDPLVFVASCGNAGVYSSLADSEFIAESREDVAWLVSALREARRDSERLDWLQRYSSYDTPPAAVSIEFDDLEDHARQLINASRKVQWPRIRDVLDAAMGRAAARVPETEDRQ